MKKILLIATYNNGKLLEIKQILNKIPFDLKSLGQISFKDNINESGKTFKENAKLKAEYAGKKSGFLTLAEDSGLEVDHLRGKPGIYSARFAPGSDQDRVNKVIRELIGIPEEKRTARFVCVAALFDPEKSKTIFFEGESRGLITEAPVGNNGFGYDPIFYNFNLKKTNAQASSEEKNLVSHRARALNKVRTFLLESIDSNH